MGIVRFKAVGNDAVRIGDADRRLQPEIAAMLRRAAAVMSITAAQARMVERCRILADQYAAATTDGERRRIAAEIATAKSAAGVTRPVSGPVRELALGGMAALIELALLPERWHIVLVEYGYAHVGYRGTGTDREPIYAFRPPPVGATEVCRRRWLKHPRTAQTQLYAAAPFKRTADGRTTTEPGSIRRVGNVPSGLVPESLSEIAGMMTRQFEVGDDDDE